MSSSAHTALLAGLTILVANPARSAEPMVLETPQLRFTWFAEDGHYQLFDKQANAAWESNPRQPRFGEAVLISGGKPQRVNLARGDLTRTADGVEAVFHPLSDQPAATIRVTVRPRPAGVLNISWQADPVLRVESVRLLDEALGVDRETDGRLVVPVREGLLIPADSDRAFSQRFGTYEYEGCHMAMFGILRRGAAALVTWDDPYVTLEVQSVLTNAPWAKGGQVLLSSLSLRKTARSFQIHLLGQGDLGTIARAYRQVAREKGWLVTWDQKLEGHPERARYFGASNVKLWSTLSRQMNEESTREQSVRVNWTFAESAQVAAHLKNDLQLNRVLFIMGGWIHRGYDNQHPDILPSAPECGGDTAFAEACQHIRSLGYLLCLHDNYQDIYRDSPSWDEGLIQKTADSKLTVGGKWAGGRAYITCAQKALDLARRPQNLPAVRRLSSADSYFIDTTYAAGLQECFDPNHPLTRLDDMKWKQELSDYAREVFGSFGSECGREWAIPHSDFFEGLTGVSGTYYHNKELPRQLGASVVPLFEMVYRDSIALYGKYGYDVMKSAEYVLHHIALGRPLNYHSIPPHLYWKDHKVTSTTPAARGTAPPGQNPGLFCQADGGWAEGLHQMDRFLKNTHEILSPLHELTARMRLTRHEFLTPDRRVQRTVFGDGPTAAEVVVNLGTSQYRHRTALGGDVVLPPFGFVVESPTFAAFHAQAWDSVDYSTPPLFTLRSLDGRPLGRSDRVRVFHAFGDTRIKVGGRIQTVEREAILKAD